MDVCARHVKKLVIGCRSALDLSNVVAATSETWIEGGVLDRRARHRFDGIVALRLALYGIMYKSAAAAMLSLATARFSCPMPQRSCAGSCEALFTIQRKRGREAAVLLESL